MAEVKVPQPPSSLSKGTLPRSQSKWTTYEDDLIIKLRGQGMKWDSISRRLPGRSSLSCRLRYQNYLEKQTIWSEDKKIRFAKLYTRYVTEMWRKIANEMKIPWRLAESMHWRLGEEGISTRATSLVL
ncbi:hypothetical protein BS50DRAFT_509204 [Corynespora cassiicola Philippines]|uniref:Myb-like domain-containing protein n=1 Tax=Corynespora cassiicola Philippines TaxID=1448308 RepID=A0A2T2N0V7_CORCC|nr:hypothetical protein BS50DRAFT_509204 [Corynespora cassiicola Philippines]